MGLLITLTWLAWLRLLWVQDEREQKQMTLAIFVLVFIAVVHVVETS